MTTQPEGQICKWTIDTLKEYFEARLYANETALEAAKTGADVAFTAEKQNRDVALGIARDAAATAITAAKDALSEKLKNGDDQLLVHIEAQRVSVAAALVSLKDLLREKDKATDMADRKQSEALAKADMQLQRRLDEINHARAQALSERASYLTRDMHEAAVAELRHQIERNRDDLSQRMLKESYDTSSAEWMTWRTEVNEFRTKIEGRGEGVSSTAKSLMYVLTALSLISGLFAAVVATKNNPAEVGQVARYNTGRLDTIERQLAPTQPAPVTVTNAPTNPVPVKTPNQ